VRVGIIVFPGSNCDRDARHTVQDLLGHEAQFLWHKESQLPADIDRLILPGGFSYGDYLRAGALARFSPIMAEVARFAERGGRVLGVCNGFQILCEAGLLPGVLARNEALKFLCQDVHLRVTATDSLLTRGLARDQVLRIPIAHADGNYTLDEAGLDALEAAGQVLLRYCDPAGTIGTGNPNGSRRAIAGIRNRAGNVVGLMPHPERASEALLGSTDGRGVLEAFLT
jgi:phosphoribosylformylglycinamidine synthase subunit PurQ / glutaminase